MKGEAGKGDSYRRVNREVYDANYDRIFSQGKHVSDEAPQICPLCGDPDCSNDYRCHVITGRTACQAPD